MLDIRKQAERFGTDMRDGRVTKLDLSQRPSRWRSANGDYEIIADTVIIATGASARYLGLEDEVCWDGGSACATCDSYFYRGAGHRSSGRRRYPGAEEAIYTLSTSLIRSI